MLHIFLLFLQQSRFSYHLFNPRSLCTKTFCTYYIFTISVLDQWILSNLPDRWIKELPSFLYFLTCFILQATIFLNPSIHHLHYKYSETLIILYSISLRTTQLYLLQVHENHALRVNWNWVWNVRDFRLKVWDGIFCERKKSG